MPLRVWVGCAEVCASYVLDAPNYPKSPAGSERCSVVGGKDAAKQKRRKSRTTETARGLRGVRAVWCEVTRAMEEMGRSINLLLLGGNTLNG